MKELKINVEDAEYDLLVELVKPDKDGYAPRLVVERGMTEFDVAINLSRKGLTTVNFISGWDRCICMLSEAGFFVMGWKPQPLKIKNMSDKG